MDVAGVVSAYGAAWNEPDTDARRRLLQSSWADDGSYCDPTGAAQGREALVAHIGAFQANMPGHRIDLTTRVDEHDGHLRFGWVMRGPDGGVVMEGMDYGTLPAGPAPTISAWEAATIASEDYESQPNRATL